MTYWRALGPLLLLQCRPWRAWVARGLQSWCSAHRCAHAASTPNHMDDNDDEDDDDDDDDDDGKVSCTAASGRMWMVISRCGALHPE